MTDATGHLQYWTLEQLAEGELPHRERTLAEAHLRGCTACSAELDRARAVIAALERLPALDPPAEFAEAVMARVRISPAALAVPVGVPAPPVAPARWLPTTVRGWMGLTAVLAVVMAPLALLGAWLSAHPMASLGALGRVARGWMADVLRERFVALADTLARSGTYARTAEFLDALPGPHAAGVPLLLVVAGCAVPLAAWTFVRLLRTPSLGTQHA